MATKTRRLADLLANIDDNSKVTSGGLLDATITATDLAPNSVDSSELVDGAVDTSHIGDLQVTAGKVASNAVTSAKIADANITAAKLSSTALASVEHVKPHIQPGTLYPAWSGLLEDNTGAYTFTDSGPGGHATTGYSGVHHTGIQKKVGSTSIKFDGVNDQIKTVDHADFDISGQFTIECWVYVNTITAFDGILSFDGSGTADFTLGFGTGGNTTKIYLYSNAGTAAAVVNSVATISLNQWYHVAVSRDGSNNTNFYLDGVYKSTASFSANHTTQSGGLALGKYYNGADEKFLDGYLDQVRVSNTARYSGTSSFTPSTSAYASDANTKFLLQSDIGGHSGAYGTAQSDGLSYYFTEIKGSKPIKDPRIGAHFGSQRHMTKSIQLLDQESASQGENIFSVDGREWCRGASLGLSYGPDSAEVVYYIDGGYMEITGYFSDANIQIHNVAARDIRWTLDGVDDSTNTDYGTATTTTPLAGRYVPAGGVQNLGLGATLGIHTLKFRHMETGAANYQVGFELIAHDKFTDATCDYNNDPTITHNANTRILAGMSVSGTGIPAGATVASVTSSTAFELSAATTGGAVTDGTLTFGTNELSIPAQNVVSYGKKLSVSASSLHHNPFAYKTDGITAWASGAHNGTSWPVGTGSSHNIDTATSLGLSNWLHSSNYYKPYNGGRVVIWVASDGTIKTSVTVMPPNAQTADGTAHAAKGNASAANNTYLPTFSGRVDQSLSEVANSFHPREFGNGGANAHSTWKDMSTVPTSTTSISAYVMDDGLTSSAASSVAAYESYDGVGAATGSYVHRYVFIGSGISVKAASGTVRTWQTYGQNLPYGTHILKIANASSNGVVLDGITIRASGTAGTTHTQSDITFHQPKMPPIPENAVVLADYMLMADFVSRTDTGTGDIQKISKGVRRCNISRDFYLQNSSGNGLSITMNINESASAFSAGFGQGSGNQYRSQFASFCTNFVAQGYNIDQRANLFIDGVDTAPTTSGNHGSNGTWGRLASDVTLGAHTVRTSEFASGYNTAYDFDVVTPIHTSSHYRPFESPFLEELVGGDRNMEQNNLVVTADGKTWDEVTRDTSYIGNVVLVVKNSSNQNPGGGVATVAVPNRFRGNYTGIDMIQKKDIAYAQNRWIFLKDGNYTIHYHSLRSNVGAGEQTRLKINGGVIMSHYSNVTNYRAAGHIHTTQYFKRGDYFQIFGTFWDGQHATLSVFREEK